MSQYATGKHSKAICDRCGWAFPYLTIVSEPGTGLRVCPRCNDGEFSLVSHPQNQMPPMTDDPQGLEFPRPDNPSVAAPNPDPVDPWSPPSDNAPGD